MYYLLDFSKILGAYLIKEESSVDFYVINRLAD